MTSLFEILKASKTGLAPDLWTLLRGRKYAVQHSAQERELEGVPPLTFNANGDNLLLWSIYGNMQQTGTPTPDSPIYPSETGDRTAQLFDKETYEQGGINDATGGDVDSTARVRSTYIAFEGGARYSFEINDDTMVVRYVHYYNAQKQWLGKSLHYGWTSDYFDFPNDGKYIRLVIQHTQASQDITVSEAKAANLMLNTGSTALPYEPYGFKLPVQCGGVTTNVYTAEPLRKIGVYTDYKSESVEYRAVKKLVLTGGEVTTVDASVKQALISISGDLKASAVAPISSHYVGKVVTAWTQLSNGEVGLSNVGTTIRICDNTNATSATAFNNYLSQQYAAGTPVCVWYVLATPTTESISAPEIPTKAGSNTFDVDTTLKPSKVYIKYKG